MDVTRLTLCSEGYNVIPCENIEDGWEYLQRGGINLVITDLNVGALELIRRMRATPRFTRTPVIISSGEGDQEKIQQTRDAGAQVYLTKPYPLSTLIAHVRRELDADA